MNRDWVAIPLGEVLMVRREVPSPEAIANGEIPIVAKISFIDGKIQLRVGKETNTGMILIRPGDFVVSGINAEKGAIAVYGEHETKPIAATIHYGAYIPKKDRVDVSYLWWLLRSRTFRELLLRHVPGGIKTELKAKRLLPIPVPLPNLIEQQRIVTRIEELATKIKEGRELRQTAIKESQSMIGAIIDEVFTSVISTHGEAKLVDICTSITDGDHITPRFADKGIKFIFVGNVSSGHLHFNNCKYVTPEYFSAIRPQRRPRRGDILYSAVGATLGIPAVVTTDEEFCFQRHVAIIKPDFSKLEPKYVWYMLQSNTTVKRAWSKTTGSAQPTISLKAIRELSIPVPSLNEQRDIISYLDILRANVDSLKQLQSQTAAELDAMLPAVLDKAFKGDL
jgi:type I restriction enzyme S subunit